MEDVELLVEVFYGFETKLKEDEAVVDKEELELIAELGEEVDEAEEELKMSKVNTINKSKVVDKNAKPGSSN
jgi:hypothetical protein